MFEYLEFIIGTFFGGLIGIWTTLIPLNRSHDSKCRDTVRDLVNTIVSNFHMHYSVTNVQLPTTTTLLDFQLRALIANTLLIPIIGKRHFHDVYYPKLSELYRLSTPSPKNMTDDEIKHHLDAINKTAVELLRIVDFKSGKIRLLPRS